MGDKFSMSVGLAHDLEFAFRRTGWEGAEEVKKLASGDTLRLVREVILGRAEIRFREITTPAPPEPLLESLGTLTLPATTGQFVARKKFVVDTSREAAVKISYLGDNFKAWFLDKIEGPAAETILRYAKLLRSSVDGPILAELGETAETTLGQLFWLMEQQPNCEGSTIQSDGRANIFYILDATTLLRAVFVFWDGDGWFVDANSVSFPIAWRGGSRVFSRNS